MRRGDTPLSRSIDWNTVREFEDVDEEFGILWRKLGLRLVTYRYRNDALNYPDTVGRLAIVAEDRDGDIHSCSFSIINTPVYAVEISPSRTICMEKEGPMLSEMMLGWLNARDGLTLYLDDGRTIHVPKYSTAAELSMKLDLLGASPL